MLKISELVGTRAYTGHKRDRISAEVLHRTLSNFNSQSNGLPCSVSKLNAKSVLETISERPYKKVCKAIVNIDIKHLKKLLDNEINDSKLSYIIIEQNDDGKNPLHLACLTNNSDILNLLLERSPKWRLQMALRDTDNSGRTPLDISVVIGSIAMFELMVKTLAKFEDNSNEWIASVLIKLLYSHKHHFLREVLEDDQMANIIRDFVAQRFISSQPLTAEDVQLLEPYCNNYIIPSTGEMTRNALVCYNTHHRDGALEEAETFSQSLEIAGFDSRMLQWSHFSDLRQQIGGHVDDLVERCSVLFVAVMSHGFQGNLLGDDNSYGEVNEVLDEITNGLRLKGKQHVPLIVMIQACQRSSLQTDSQREDAETVTSSDGGHVVLRRPHTLLLMATMSGRVAYRGEYTSAFAEQLRKAAGGEADVIRMHTNAVQGLRRDQQPEMRSTLRHHLVLPSKQE